MGNHIDWSEIREVVLDEKKITKIAANLFYSDAIQKFILRVSKISLSAYNGLITESKGDYILKLSVSKTMYEIVFYVTSNTTITILDISAVDIKT